MPMVMVTVAIQKTLSRVGEPVFQALTEMVLIKFSLWNLMFEVCMLLIVIGP